MLGKLLKHEFRATARVMGFALLIVLGLALVSNLSIRLMDSASSGPLQILMTLVFISFFIAIFAAALMSLIIMIQRFYKNLLGSEGYLMFTLPANVHSLVWSKLIVSVVWFIATGVVMFLSVGVALFAFNEVEFSGESFSSLSEAVNEVLNALHTRFGITTADVVLYCVEFIINTLVSALSSCLLIYAAMAIGHSFSNNKGLLSVVFFFLLSFAVQLLTSVVGVGAVYDADMEGLALSMSQTGHAVLLGSVAVSLVYGAIFYVVTTLMLKKRLNLG